MNPTRAIETFNYHYPLVGPVLWMVNVQYFIIQLVVALDFKNAYSLTQNTISDLGNTVCGNYGGSYVCSPLHSLMNASFVMLALSMIVGSMLIYHEFKEGRGTAIGFSFMAVAGLGTLLVGLFPENTIGALHFLGAVLAFLIGNLGIFILGCSLNIPKTLRVYTLTTGIISLTALALFFTNHFLFLGKGGMERLTGYPQTIWLIVFGVYMSRKHFRKHMIKA